MENLVEFLIRILAVIMFIAAVTFFIINNNELQVKFQIVKENINNQKILYEIY